MKWQPVSASGLVWLALALTPCHADSITLTSSHDNTLIQEPSSSAPLSNGSGSSLFVGETFQSTGTDVRRGLVMFNFSGIPAGAQITSVSLKLFVTAGVGNTAEAIALFPALAAWGEGASSTGGGAGAPAQPPDATWFDSMYATTAWTTPGGDYSALASASATASKGATSVTWTSSGMVQEVQAWLDGTQPNFGWLLIGDESSTTTGFGDGSAHGFGTRENANAGLRPELTVDYNVVPVPPSFVLLGIGGLGLAIGRRRR